MAPVSASASLFRSASSSSLASSSDDPFLFETPNPTAKRTRKRFTGSQLTMLEQLFHHATHPSRDEREALARELNLYDYLFSLSVFYPRFSLIRSVAAQRVQSRDDMVPKPSSKRAQSKPRFHHHRRPFRLRLRTTFLIPSSPSIPAQKAVPHVHLAFPLVLFVTLRAPSQIAFETSDARNDGVAL